MKRFYHAALLPAFGMALWLSSCGEKNDSSPGAKWEAWERVNNYDALGNSPLVNAIISDAPLDVVRDLCEAGADVNLVNRRNEKMHPGIPSYPPVFHAMQKQNIAIIDLLLEKGAKPIDGNGATLLCEAVEYEIDNELPPVVTTHLIGKGFDINQMSRGEDYPLFLAVLRESLPMITLLLEKGADPDINIDENRSILEFARQMTEPKEKQANTGRIHFHSRDNTEQAKSIYNLLLKHSKKTE